MSRPQRIPAAALLAGGFTSAHRDPHCTVCGERLMRYASDGSARCEEHLVAAEVVGPRLPTADERRQESERATEELRQALWSEHLCVMTFLDGLTHLEPSARRRRAAKRRAELVEAHERASRAWDRQGQALRLLIHGPRSDA